MTYDHAPERYRTFPLTSIKLFSRPMKSFEYTAQSPKTGGVYIASLKIFPVKNPKIKLKSNQDVVTALGEFLAELLAVIMPLFSRMRSSSSCKYCFSICSALNVDSMSFIRISKSRI